MIDALKTNAESKAMNTTTTIPCCHVSKIELTIIRPVWICVSGKLGQGNHVITIRPSFLKSFVFNTGADAGFDEVGFG